MATERQLRTVLEGGSYFEPPRWHEGTWWVSAFYRRTVSRLTADGRGGARGHRGRRPAGRPA